MPKEETGPIDAIDAIDRTAEIAKITDEICELVPKLPKRAFVTTRGETLELSVDKEVEYGGEGGWREGNDKLRTPPRVYRDHVTVKNVDGSLKLDLRYFPAYVSAVPHEAGRNRPAGYHPENVGRGLVLLQDEKKKLYCLSLESNVGAWSHQKHFKAWLHFWKQLLIRGKLVKPRLQL